MAESEAKPNMRPARSLSKLKAIAAEVKQIEQWHDDSTDRSGLSLLGILFDPSAAVFPEQDTDVSQSQMTLAFLQHQQTSREGLEVMLQESESYLEWLREIEEKLEKEMEDYRQNSRQQKRWEEWYGKIKNRILSLRDQIMDEVTDHYLD